MANHELSRVEADDRWVEQEEGRKALWISSAVEFFPKDLIDNPRKLRIAYKEGQINGTEITDEQTDIALRHPHIEISFTISQHRVLNPNQLAYVLHRIDTMNALYRAKGVKTTSITSEEVKVAQRILGNSKEVIDVATGYAGVLRTQASYGS